MRSGQSVVEILIAVMIFVLTISAAVSVIYGGQSISIDASESNIAIRLAREDQENARMSARSDFAGLADASSTTGEFTIVRTVTSTDPDVKKVTTRVLWSRTPLREQEVLLTTLITNWRMVEDVGGDTGGGGISGDWKDPVTLGAIDLGPGNEATGLDVFNSIVYLSAVASDQKKDDFFIVDATNGQVPVVVGSTSTGPGLNAVDVAGLYAYVGQDFTSNQLQVIDISTPATPRVHAQYDLPGVSGAGSVGWSLFYSGAKVYMGTKNASGPEFHVIDVADPANPAELGSFEVGADVNSIYVTGDIAYLATADNAKELLVLNIATSSAPQEIGVYNATATQSGKVVYVSGNRLYLGRQNGTDKELYVLDIANPTNPQLLGAQEIGADVNGFRSRDNLLFVGTSDSNKEFQVWEITDPTDMSLWSSFNFPQVATGIDYESNLVYVSVRSNDALRIITSQQ